MAGSDSTNPTVRSLYDVTSDLESLQDTLQILNGMTNEQACEWSIDDDKETVMRMTARIIVLTNTMSQKLDEFDALVSQSYKLAFAKNKKETAQRFTEKVAA